MHERVSRQGARRPPSGTRRNIHNFMNQNSMPSQASTGGGEASPFLAELLRQTSHQTSTTAASGSTVSNIRREESKYSEPQMTAQNSTDTSERPPTSGLAGRTGVREERKAHTLPRLGRMQSEQQNSGPSPFADILSRLGGLMSGSQAGSSEAG